MTDVRLHSLLLAAALAAPAVAQDPSPMFQGVSQLLATGYPGAIQAYPGTGVIPLVAGDDDATLPNLFAAIGSLGSPGSGHVLAVGQDGFLGDAANSQLDTLRFNTQAITWLDGLQTQRVAILAGHGEFANALNMNVVVAALAGAGFTVSHVPGEVTPGAIAGSGVVVIGNAWQAFQPSELAAIEAHVAGGGGLYLAGLGWSYPSQRDFAQYPMNVIGAPYGLGWMRYGISDPTNNVAGSAVFSRFYPNCGLHAVDGALAHLQTALASHPNDLDLHLRSDAQARTEFSIAAAHATAGIVTLPTAGGVRAALDATLRSMMLQHPQWIGMAGNYDPTLDDELAVARAAFGAAVVSAFDLDPARLTLVEPALGLLDPAVDVDYAVLLREHGLLLLDNRAFPDVHREIILDLMTSIPDVPRDLQRMTCRNELSTSQATRNFPFAGLGVNVFEAAAINTPENQFPADIAARSAPIFATTVCHEVAHVIDSYLSRTQPRFATRKAALLAAAGTDDQQFLRSQVTAQFFQSNPQEFFASLANVWNTDSVHTLRLAVQRFANGKDQPVQQALFMADTYGRDGMTTPIYSMAATGRITVTPAELSRDVAGRITAICTGSTGFRFSYDAAGNVTSATEVPGSCGSAWQDLGLGLAGGSGVPVAAGGGAFLPGQPIAVRLHHAVPSSLAAVVVGFQRIDQPFFDGTLVPQPYFSQLIGTDASGSGAMTLAWPAGMPSGVRTYYQCWLVDVAGPAGLAASNGLLGISP